MAITFTNQGASANPDVNNNTDLASYSNTSWTPPAELVFCFCTFRVVTGTAVSPTMTGNGLTWTKVADVIVTTRGVSLFAADGTGASAGANTWDFAAVTQTYFNALFASASGVDLSGGIAAAFVQTPSNSGTGTSGSVTLAAAGNSNNRPIAFFTHAVNEAVTARTNWTELDAFNNTADSRGMDSQYRGDTFETTASASWTTSLNWIGLAAELKATVAGGATQQMLGLLGVGS